MNKRKFLTAFTLSMIVTLMFTGAVLAGALTSVTESIQYADKPDALGFKAYLPEGCIVVAVKGDGSPAFRQLADGTVEIFWTEVPASPVNFTYKYQGAAQGKIAADVISRVGGKEVVESR
jgi:hypothetical protein